LIVVKLRFTRAARFIIRRRNEEPMVRTGRGWRETCSVAGVLVALASCAGHPSGENDVGEVDEPGSVTGQLAIYVADFADGTSETRYFLRSPAGDERRLVFPEHPTVEPGSKIRVWGDAGSDEINVARFKVVADAIGTQSAPLIGTAPQPPRVFCSVLVTINGGAVPANLGIDQTETQFHVGPTSVNAYYIENSYGRNSIGGKTYGPLNYTMTGCDTSGLSKALHPMVADQCDQYGFVMVPEVSSCGWAGLGEVGTATNPATDTWYNGTLGCVATVQEPGHNFGMNHSSSITCPGAPFADDLTNCTHNEYGDKFDTMGGGCRHMNVWQKQYQGWLGGCNAVKVNSSGTFNLLPTEQACDGVQSLQIPFPNGKTRPFTKGKTDNTDTTMTTYYLEYRQSLGFDKGMTPQVLVHAAPNPVTGGSKAAPHTWLINASGATGNNANPGLTAGKSFSDPAGGLTITVNSMDSEKAVIQIDYPGGPGGDPTCLGGTTLTAPGPTTCAGAITPDGGAITPPDSGPIGTTTTGGTGGTGGRGGAGGTSGTGGPPDSGQAGSTSAGTGGAGGTGGDTTGATSTTGATTGPSTGVTAGTTGPSTVTTGGGAAQHARPSDLQGGCSCKLGTAPQNGGRAPSALLALGLAGLAVSRRRKRD
jgi:hypothetical protein